MSRKMKNELNAKELKNVYHKWEHESSAELCKQYNKIVHTNLTVEALSP